MKKWVLSFVAALFLISLAGCGSLQESSEPQKGGLSMATFSYEQDAAEYQDGTPGVNPNAFVNVDASPIKDQLEAVERAEKECTIEYNATSEYYDSETEMWRIDFYTAERDENGRLIALLGNSQSVYLNSDGIKQLIVYGE